MLNDAIQHGSPPTLTKAKEAWEQDLDVTIPDITWDVVIDRSHSSSICIRHCYSYLGFKVAHYLFLTTEKLSETSSICYASFSSCHRQQ